MSVRQSNITLQSKGTKHGNTFRSYVHCYGDHLRHAGLSIIGLSDMATTVENSENGGGFLFEIDMILLPYILLPLAIIATVTTRLIKRVFRYFKKRDLERKYYHRDT